VRRSRQLPAARRRPRPDPDAHVQPDGHRRRRRAGRWPRATPDERRRHRSRSARGAEVRRTSGRLAMTDLLRAEKLSVSFGGVKALTDVDIAVENGTLVGLIGPNGAGKTTFIDAVGGFVPAP